MNVFQNERVSNVETQSVCITLQSYKNQMKYDQWRTQILAINKY